VIEGVGQALWDWLPFSSWAGGLPTWVKQGVLALLGLALVGLIVASIRRLRRSLPGTWRRDSSIQLSALLGAFILGYLGQLTVTYLFTVPVLDPSDIDQRILAPVLLTGGLVLFALAELLMRSAPARRRVAIVPAGLALVYAAWFLPQGWKVAAGLNQAGAGYTSQSWQSSPTIAGLRSLPAETPLITNESAGVMLWLDRPAYDLPLPTDGEPDLALDRFGDGPGELDRIFREQGAAFVVFNSISAQLAARYGEQAAGARLAELTQGLELFARLDDGEVFFYPIEAESK
ncbi:MAG: hypothetical protein ACRDHG_07280, partial [Anaerolineales bacterium]